MSAQSSAAEAIATTYDEIQYESLAHPQTHPAQMHTVGTLFSLTPPDIRTARVLELGCAGGGNILPLAISYPKAKFQGFDLSREQIADANRRKEQLGLSNISFAQQDIMAFDLKANREKFDYIICHGVYSWVPEPVRVQILKLCRECLSPNGLAVITYNTLPGWSVPRSVREMMVYHASRYTTTREKIDQARALVEFVAANAGEAIPGYRAALEEQRALLATHNDAYIFHEYLESFNSQFYLHEFVTQAAGEKLAYVGDAALTSMFVGNMPANVTQMLSTIGDFVQQEQYMDFLINRRFRSSIVCKTPEKLKRNLRNEQIMDYHLYPRAVTIEGPQDPAGPISFKSGGVTFTTHNAQAGNLLLELVAAPAPVAATELVARVKKKMGLADDGPVKAALVEFGLQLALRGFISLHPDTPVLATTVSAKPAAAPMARLQAGIPGCTKLTSLLNTVVTTDAMANLILTLLDGTRTAEDVIDDLTQKALKGKITVWKDEKALSDEKAIREELARTVNNLLPSLAKQALLVS